MDFGSNGKGTDQEIIDLFIEAFTASEGTEEGQVVGGLARDLLATTDTKDLFVFTAIDAGRIVGAIVFSRLFYDEDERTVFVLAPVAVATARHGQGIGQTLIAHGLNALRQAHVDVAITYGDPNFYGKVGFQPIAQATASAPFTLNHPHGWLGQSLREQDLKPLKGPSRCVAALNDPAFW